MKTWWESLQQRERWLLIIAGILLSITCFYTFIWYPIQNSIAQAQQEVVNNQALVNYMQNARDEITILRKNGNPQDKPTINPNDILNIVDNTLKAGSLGQSKPTITQQSGNKVSVNFTTVAFDPLINWLNTLWVQYKIDVDQISLNKIEPGIVEAQVVLRVEM